MDWMTETVVGLIRGIREDNAWDRTPVLADALEESGYDNVEVLAALRSYDESLRGLWFERVISGEITTKDVKEAKEWLTNHAANFASYDYENEDEDGNLKRLPSPGFSWLMRVCDQYVETGEDTFLNFDTPDEAYSDREKMWKCYAILTGTKIPAEEDDYVPVPFRCGC